MADKYSELVLLEVKDRPWPEAFPSYGGMGAAHKLEGGAQSKCKYCGAIIPGRELQFCGMRCLRKFGMREH